MITFIYRKEAAYTLFIYAAKIEQKQMQQHDTENSKTALSCLLILNDTFIYFDGIAI
jgi:hypothetical protein